MNITAWGAKSVTRLNPATSDARPKMIDDPGFSGVSSVRTNSQLGYEAILPTTESLIFIRYQIMLQSILSSFRHCGVIIGVVHFDELATGPMRHVSGIEEDCRNVKDTHRVKVEQRRLHSVPPGVN